MERYNLALDAKELRIIQTLREMPESPLKVRVLRLLDSLVDFARNPRCAELQPDGVPCEHPHADCDTCQVVVHMLDTLAFQIPGALPKEVKS